MYYLGRMPSVWGSAVEQILVQDPCIPNRRLGIKKDYTVVGIYTAPEFAYGRHNFQANTIFVPKQSVPEAERYEDRTTPFWKTEAGKFLRNIWILWDLEEDFSTLTRGMTPRQMC